MRRDAKNSKMRMPFMPFPTPLGVFIGGPEVLWDGRHAPPLCRP